MKESIPLDFAPQTPEDLERALADPMWRVCSGALYHIMVKAPDMATGNTVIPFKPNAAQRRLIANLWRRNIILKARQLGYCLDPSTRVLTADLRWVRIDTLMAGDEVVAVDEDVPGGKGMSRKMRTAAVIAAAKVHRQAFRVTFDDGRSVVCTAQHPWLSRNKKIDPQWRSIDGTGNKVCGRLRVGTQVRWITKPWGETTSEDGWFGGMLDGEGSIAKRNTSAGLCVSQLLGPVFDRLQSYLASRGYNYRIEDDKTPRKTKYGKSPVPKLCIGRMDELFRIIGQTRPTRFIKNRFWEGRDLPGKRSGIGWATITSIEPLGEQTLIDLQTTHGTYIAEGFVSHNTTLVAILWLDHALFNRDQRCGIIAQDREAAEAIFRDKVKFAYERLPPELRAAMPLARDSASELLFAHNNSSIRVATSMRSGTLARLHVSEFGKICAKFPDKAREVITGSLPAVPTNGIAIIESTAEGQGGDFFDMVQRARALAQQGSALSPRDYRFHFAPWHDAPDYAIEPKGVVITPKDHEYFDTLEGSLGKQITLKQRAWYIATRSADFAGDPEKMWQEYPSTPDEAFQVSTEGTYYAVQLAAARRDGRIGRVPHVSSVPVHSAWDIGHRDGTAIWLFQKVGAEHRFLKFIEGWGEPYQYFIRQLQDLGWIWGTHYLPHDAANHRQLGHRNMAPIEMLQELAPGWRFEIIPRIDDVLHGIQMTRAKFSEAWFDEEGCREGLAHLSLYRKSWNERLGTWSERPLKDIHSEAADSFRMWAEGFHDHETIAGTRPRRKSSVWAS